MSERPTPETDDLARGNHVVPTEWAEQLEIERNEAREELKKCREDSICYAEYMRRCGYSAAYEESQENADRATIILNKHKESAK
jgi:hypothetical protein